MSATRLLVLGAVRIFQPAHGYLIRRELLSWGVESWAAINPGSIYNQLRTLTKEGLTEEVPDGEGGKGPAKVGYRLTLDGESAFLGLLTHGLWEIDDRDPHLLPAALCFLPALTREQAAEALEARETALQLQLKGLAARSRMMLEQRLVPPHTAESLELWSGQLSGQLGWVRGARERVAAGHYRFAGEPGAGEGPVGERWYGALEKPA
jgi:DNA-binding PadR family transcriptional regulator